MKILEINIVNFASTGNIMRQVADVARSDGHEVICCFYANRNKAKDKDCIYIGNKVTHNIHKKLCRYTGYNGCFSVFSTWNFLRKVKKFGPDIIHLHNLHNCYINLPMLFKFIKKNDIKVVWTLHDCWSFTGQCPYFTASGCSKWKTGCYDCPRFDKYPASKVDRTRKMWALKKKWFTGVSNMTLVTPSEWLSSLVKESYLKDYPVTVINNGIDLNVFRPVQSDFRKARGLEDKYIVLGVASVWEERKGLDVFIELAGKLDDRFAIVLVGTNDEIDKKLPDRIISIHRTNDQKELAEIYTAADLFLNPTREENYPTVNMEAIACGTPVLTFDTGGCKEIVDERSGLVITDESIENIEKKVAEICTGHVFSEADCLKRAESFDSASKYRSYLQLFEQIIG